MPFPESAVQAFASAKAGELPTLLIVGDPNGLNVAREARSNSNSAGMWRLQDQR